MYEGAYELDRSADGGYTARISARGTSVLASPMINRGTAFTARERQELGLTGLLPSGVSTLDGQLRRTYAQYSAPSRRPGEVGVSGEPAQPQRGAVLPAAQRAHRGDAADRLHPDGRVGDRAVQSSEFRRPRGVYLSVDHPDEVETALRNTGLGAEDVDLLVATDSEGILGIGDQGVGGIEISVGKLAVYTAAAGIHPRRVIPVVLDMGTDNLALLNDEMYLGERHARIRDERYDELIDAYVTACQKLFPHAMLHWEDFGASNARRILDKYADQVCTFNDDMQGTAAVVLAAAFSAVRAAGVPDARPARRHPRRRHRRAGHRRHDARRHDPRGPARRGGHPPVLAAGQPGAARRRQPDACATSRCPTPAPGRRGRGLVGRRPRASASPRSSPRSARPC